MELRVLHQPALAEPALAAEACPLYLPWRLTVRPTTRDQKSPSSRGKHPFMTSSVYS